jgi:hypothetical protein
MRSLCSSALWNGENRDTHGLTCRGRRGRRGSHSSHGRLVPDPVHLRSARGRVGGDGDIPSDVGGQVGYWGRYRVVPSPDAVETPTPQYSANRARGATVWGW